MDDDGVTEFLAAINQEANQVQMRAEISLSEALLTLGRLQAQLGWRA